MSYPLMQKTTHEVLNELGIKDDALLDVAIELERIALSDEYFIETKLYANAWALACPDSFSASAHN